MAIPIIMPRQGQSVESCILTAFHKKPGEQVKKGDILFEYETDKASFEEESPDDGVFLRAFFEEGDEIPVLQTVCVIGKQGEDISGFATESHSPLAKPAGEEAKKTTQKVTKIPTTPETEKSAERLIRISPRARKKAKMENVPVHELAGTGPNGRIISRDVDKWLERNASEVTQSDVESKKESEANVKGKHASFVNTDAEDDFEIKPLTNIRKIIANAMHHSLQSSAQLTHHLSADARALLACRKKAKESGMDITINDFVCFAVIKVLKKFPRVNAHLNNDNLKIFKAVHLGLAVDTERGLMVPVIKKADELNIKGLSTKMHELAAACRKGNIDPDLIAPESASFTVSNLGNYGVEMFTPVINLPQVSILGVNTIIYRPKPLEDGTLALVPHIGLSLTYDHRALDGGEATRFVKEVANQIETLEASRVIED